MVKIVPILLCGGSGTRLWPLSRKTHPKQFSNIVGNKSLLQATAILLKDSGFADPIAVTCDSLRFITTDQLADVGVTAQKVCPSSNKMGHQSGLSFGGSGSFV